MCWASCQDDLYTITDQPGFQDYIERSVIEYRFLIGKNINNYNLSRVFKNKSVRYYNGLKHDSIIDKDVDLFVDLRGNFIYGVYVNRFKH